MSVKFLLSLNKCFRPIPHPFNEELSGGKTYGEWEYERGKTTIDCFRPEFDEEKMFFGKTVLDVGCGEGGKSLYYASCGANHVYGVDTVRHYAEKSSALAKKLVLDEKFTFVNCSSLELPFPDETFDTVIMNDFFEHVSNPAEAVKEAMRTLKFGGQLFINFPPYYHPYGAHLTDAINIPWVHLFFSEKTMVEAYKTLVEPLPDAERRLALKLSSDGEHIDYINRMTQKKARGVFSSLGIDPTYKKTIPLRRFLTPIYRMPLLRECFTRMAVYVFTKEGTNKHVKEKTFSFAGGNDDAGNNIDNGVFSRNGI
ncbi:MAG: class I SAM-dependent methyltransferase [Clostridia bacterium]|nr:class I SAM-dependent methyltransferase [Clostridia bacterium]